MSELHVLQVCWWVCWCQCYRCIGGCADVRVTRVAGVLVGVLVSVLQVYWWVC